jgi:uncharacterized DUF497 family protein
VQFEWDEAKAQANLRKHGIRFEVAAEVFFDPFAILEQDRIEHGEYRWRTIGMVNGHMLLVVANVPPRGGRHGDHPHHFRAKGRSAGETTL